MKHKVSALSPGEMHPFEVEGKKLLLVRKSSGEYSCIQNKCTHADVKLSEGILELNEVECPAHGARFCVDTGEALCMPAVVGVRVYPVIQENDEIFIEI